MNFSTEQIMGSANDLTLKDAELRGSPENPSTNLSNPAAWLVEAFGGIPSSAGIVVNEETAIRASAVYACVHVISETIATIPLNLYMVENDKRRIDAAHPLHRLLHFAPNPECSSVIWREYMQACLLLWGNCYAEKQYDNSGRLVGLWPLHPMCVRPERRNRKRVYFVRLTPVAPEIEIPAEKMFHIPGLGFDGVKGYSIIRIIAKQAVGLALATEEFGARLFSNGAMPGGVLEHPKALSPAAHIRLREEWNKYHSGPANSHRMAILEEGMKWNPVGIPPEDAQFLETRKFQVEEIARIYRVPLHMIGALDRATFNNIEHQSIEFVRNTIEPICVRWAQELHRQVLDESERQSGRFFGFKTERLLQGDLKSRYEAYAIGRQWGWLSPDDVQDKEGENHIGEENGGHLYLAPMNMVAFTGAPDDMKNKLLLLGRGEQQDGTGDIAAPNQDPKTGKFREQVVRESFRPLLLAASRRVCRKEALAMRRASKEPGTFRQRINEFYGDIPDYFIEHIEPVVVAYRAALASVGVSCPDIDVAGLAKSHALEVTANLCSDNPAIIEGQLSGLENTTPDYIADAILGIGKDEP